MTHYTYLFINIAIILIPLLFTFYPTVYYYKKFKPVLLTTAIVCIPFIIKDFIFTHLEIWSFNPVRITGLYLLNLPIEEILFFITVPYSTIFIYECCEYYFPQKTCTQQSKPRQILISIFLISIFLTTISFFNNSKLYTVIISLVSIPTLVTAYYQRIFTRPNYWRYILFSLIGFLTINFLLTSFPVVEYNPIHILNIRITTIPIEDFLYFWNMNTLIIVCYILIKNKWQRK